MKILIGTNVDDQLRNLNQKICFILFSVIVVKYSADFYADILEIKYIYSEVPFDTFEQMKESGFQTMVGFLDYHFVFHALQYMEEGVRLLVKDAKPSGFMYKCVERIHDEHNAICIVPDGNLTNNIDKSMKIAKPLFACENWNYRMGYRSPYFNRLQEMCNQLFATGVYDYFNRRNNTVVEDLNVPVEENALDTAKILIAVAVIGNSLAAIVLSLELVFHYLKSKHIFK